MLPVLPWKHSRRITLGGKEKAQKTYLFLPFAEGCISPTGWSHQSRNQCVMPKERQISGDDMRVERGTWGSTAGFFSSHQLKFLLFQVMFVCSCASCAQGLFPGCLTRGKCGYWCKGMGHNILVAVAGKFIWGDRSGPVSEKMASAQRVQQFYEQLMKAGQ